MQSEFNSQALADGCQVKNLENLFWTCTGTKRKALRALKKNPKVVPASWFWESVSCCLNIWIWQWYKNCSARWLCLPGVFSFSFASSKACPDCCRTLKKEELLHTLQNLCHHPNRQRQTSTAALASSWAMLMGILGRAVRVLQELQLIPGSGTAVQVFGRWAPPGLQHHPYSALGGQGWGALLNHGDRWSEASHMHLVHMWSRRVKQGAQAARRGTQKKVIALQWQSWPSLPRGSLCPLP